MLQVATWTKVVVSLILIAGILIAMPNALPDNVRQHLPPMLQRTLSLGLDLQGGSYLLLEVDLAQVQKDKLESLMGDIRLKLRKAHIGMDGLQANGDQVSVRIPDPAQFEQAKTLLQELNPVVGGSVLAIGARDYDASYPGDNTIVLKTT